MQLLAYADDIDIIARSLSVAKEHVMSLSGAASQMGLTINENKTKLMVVTSQQRVRNVGQNVTMDNYFEATREFIYLGR